MKLSILFLSIILLSSFIICEDEEPKMSDAEMQEAVKKAMENNPDLADKLNANPEDQDPSEPVSIDAPEPSEEEDEGPKTLAGFTEDEESEMRESAETHEFQAEVSRLLDILINSLYTQKDIFLRECISNGADALDKIRFLSVQDADILGEQQDQDIRIEIDNVAKTLSITDTGIGMTKSDLINHIGTIAHTGTTQFLEAIAKGGSLNLIGQFGVGFYSYFLVSNKVTVISKHNDDDQMVWESQAGSTFTLSKDPRGNTMKRGTKVILHLKQDAHEYLDYAKIEGLVKKYSEFITFPIYLMKEKEVTKEVEVSPEEEVKDETDEGKTDEEMEVKDEDDKPKEPKTKTVTENVWDWEHLNEAKALWLRPKEEIEESEYKDFYKSMSKDYDEPLQWIHFKGEGDVDFTSVLYIPKKAPSDLFESYDKKNSAMKLYVRRVLISDTFEDMMPRYLNFIKGVVDSDDIPLNVNREQLQQLRLMKVIQRRLVRKVLEMIRKLAVAEDDEDKKEATDDMTEEEKDEQEKKKEEKKKELQERYVKFWEQFGKNIKLGIIEDAGNRNKLAKLSRFYSTNDKDTLSSLDDYIDRAKKSQDSIYYLAGDDRSVIQGNPLLQGLVKRGYEVLLCDDPIDEFTMQHLSEYEKKKLVNVGKGDFKFPESEDDKTKVKKLKKMYQPLTEWLKTQYKDKVDNVNVSLKLVDDPMAVTSSEYGHSAAMTKINKAQAFATKDKQAMYGVMKKIVEINPYHPFIRELLERVKSEVDQDTEEAAKLLFDVALMNSGFELEDSSTFSSRFHKVMSDAMGIPRDSKVEEFEQEDEEEEVPETKDENVETETLGGDEESENSSEVPPEYASENTTDDAPEAEAPAGEADL